MPPPNLPQAVAEAVFTSPVVYNRLLLIFGVSCAVTVASVFLIGMLKNVYRKRKLVKIVIEAMEAVNDKGNANSSIT